MLTGICTLQDTCSSISTKHSRVIILICYGLAVPALASFTALSSLVLTQHRHQRVQDTAAYLQHGAQHDGQHGAQHGAQRLHTIPATIR